MRQRIDEEHWRVHLLGKPEEWTILATAAQLSCAEEPTLETPKPVKWSRRHSADAPTKPSRSQHAIDAEMIPPANSPRSRSTSGMGTTLPAPNLRSQYPSGAAHLGGKWSFPTGDAR